MPTISYAGEQTPTYNPVLMAVVLGLIGLQSLLIIGLQRSRLKNKAAKNLLKAHQRDLELRIQDRTQNLHNNNHELETAIENHKAIAVQLMDTKHHLHTMINSVPDILVGIDADAIVTYWNTAAFEKTGLSFDKARGTYIFTALPQLPISPEQLLSIIKSERPFINQRIQHTENDEHKFYDLRIYPLISTQKTGALIQLNNVTKQVQIENMMIQNEKMSSLGELAAGIAHEINNPLGIILHNAQNIMRRTSANLPSNLTAAAKFNICFEDVRNYLHDREVDQFLDNIKEAGERAGAIVANMLEFSRKTHNEKTWVDIKKLIEQAIELNIKAGYSSKKMESIKTETKFSPDLPLVFASAPELQQVILNLLRNAYQALILEDYDQPNELKVSVSVVVNTRKHEIIIDICDNWAWR